MDIRIAKNDRSYIGLSAIWMVLEKNVVSGPTDSGDDYIDGTFTLKPNTFFDRFWFEAGTGNFNEDCIDDRRAGDYYSSEVGFKTARSIPVSRKKVMRLKNRKVCLIYLDRNGFYKVGRNMTCKVKESSGRVGGGLNGYTFNLKGSALKKMGFWDANPLFFDIMEAQLPQGSFTVSSTTTLNSVTISGIEYIEKDNVITTQGNLASENLDVGLENILHGDITNISFHLASADYTSVDVTLLTSLQTLRINSANVDSLDITKNTALTYLQFFGHNLTTLDISKNTLLNNINVRENDLTSLDISNNTALQYLYLNRNDLTTASIDAIMVQLVAHGLNNGVLNIADNAGTYSDTTSYNTLIARNWTITT
jgi:hypothetical protein